MCVLCFEKLSAGKYEYVEHFPTPRVIFHEVHGPVTCSGAVVHHFRLLYSVMDGRHTGPLNISVPSFFFSGDGGGTILVEIHPWKPKRH